MDLQYNFLPNPNHLANNFNRRTTSGHQIADHNLNQVLVPVAGNTNMNMNMQNQSTTHYGSRSHLSFDTSFSDNAAFLENPAKSSTNMSQRQNQYSLHPNPTVGIHPPPPPPPRSHSHGQTNNTSNSNKDHQNTKKKSKLVSISQYELEQLIHSHSHSRANSSSHEINTEQAIIVQKLKKELDDMYFLSEFDESQSQIQPQKLQPPLHNGHSSSNQIADLENKLFIAQNEINRLSNDILHHQNTMANLKSQNIDLSAQLEFSKPNPMSIPDAYKKALKYQSELAEARTLLQDESLARERAETNLHCLKMERDTLVQDLQAEKSRVEKSLMERDTLLQDLQVEKSRVEKSLKEVSNDLGEGVNIMKGLEEELLKVQQDLENEQKQSDDLMQQIKDLEENLAKSESKRHDMEQKLKNEKIELEQKCETLFSEVQDAKLRVGNLTQEREEKDQQLQSIMETKLAEQQLEHSNMIASIQTEHEETIKEYESSLEEKNAELSSMQTKFKAMETGISMFNEHARNEVNSIKEQMNATKKELTDQMELCKKNEKQAREQNIRLQQELDDLINENDTLVQEINQLNEELNSAEENLKQYEEEFPELKEELADLKELKKLNTTMVAKEHQYMRDKKKWSAKEQKMKEDLDALSNELSLKESENEELMKDHEHLQSVIEEIEKENSELFNKLQEIETSMMNTMTLNSRGVSQPTDKRIQSNTNVNNTHTHHRPINRSVNTNNSHNNYSNNTRGLKIDTSSRRAKTPPISEPEEIISSRTHRNSVRYFREDTNRRSTGISRSSQSLHQADNNEYNQILMIDGQEDDYDDIQKNDLKSPTDVAAWDEIEGSWNDGTSVKSSRSEVSSNTVRQYMKQRKQSKILM